MAINLIPEPTGGAPIGVVDYNYQNALQQALHGMNEYNNILTEWDTTTEPEIAVGARFIHDGGIYECQGANEAIAGAPAEGHVYIKATEALGVITVEFVTNTVGYAFDPIKGGWYHADGTQLFPFILLLYDTNKWKKSKALIINFNETSDLSSCQIYPHAAMETIVQDDSVDSISVPASCTYWPFSSPNLINSAGVAPTIRHNVKWKPAGTAEAKFARRGVIYFSGGYTVYTYAFGNEHTIMFRLYPKWAYNIATTVFIMSNMQNTASSDDSFNLYYDPAVDKLHFFIRDDATHIIHITTDAYANNAALQIPHDILIRWSKVGNDADMWINNIRQGAGVAGTKTVTGNISALAITKTELSIGANAQDASGYIDFVNSLFYMQDLVVMDTSNITHLSNYDGSVNVKPYYETDYLSGLYHAWQQQADGSAGFKNVFSEKGCFDSIDFGAGQIKMKKIPIGVWNMDATMGINVTHGLTDCLKIIGVFVRIFSDALSNSSLERMGDSADPNLLAGGEGSSGLVAVTVNRRTGGYYDSAFFDDATMNRGYVWILYEI
jgi:hypothetical protein